jgi:hypothetical protein
MGPFPSFATAHKTLVVMCTATMPAFKCILHRYMLLCSNTLILSNEAPVHVTIVSSRLPASRTPTNTHSRGRPVQFASVEPCALYVRQGLMRRPRRPTPSRVMSADKRRKPSPPLYRAVLITTGAHTGTQSAVATSREAGNGVGTGEFNQYGNRPFFFPPVPQPPAPRKTGDDGSLGDRSWR